MIGVRSFVGFGLSVALLSACASSGAGKPVLNSETEETKPVIPSMPETLEEALALANDLPVCESNQDFAIGKRAGSGENQPVFIRRCIPLYPDILKANGYVAACYAGFDISPAGSPMGIVVKCNTQNANGRDAAEELDLAHIMTLRIIYRAMSEMRFEPPGEDVPQDKPLHVVQPVRFALESDKSFPPFPPELGEE